MRSLKSEKISFWGVKFKNFEVILYRNSNFERKICARKKVNQFLQQYNQFLM